MRRESSCLLTGAAAAAPAVLLDPGLAPRLTDLLTSAEEAVDDRTRHLRFDIPFLAHRLAAATDWLMRDPQTQHLPVGSFGASTGPGAGPVPAGGPPQLVG